MAPVAMDQPMRSTAATHGHRKASTVTASVLHGPRDLRLETRSLPPPNSHELQIEVKATGICGSDVSYYNKFANGDLCACQPLSLGHEASGLVVAVGEQVSGFQIGDRVALEVGVACGNCGICRKGRYNLCKKLRFRSSAKTYPHYQGTLQERINHPAVWCHKLPDHVSYEAAALLEPLSVAIHALNRATPMPGSTALVIGAGTVGLLTAAMALQSGCSAVTIADIDAGRVEYALSRGFATHGYVVRPGPPQVSSMNNSGVTTPSSAGAMTPQSVFSAASRFDSAKANAVNLIAAGFENADQDEDEDEGFDVTFECTGKEPSMHTSLYATKPGGKVIMVGMGTPIQTLPLSVAHLREIDILGVFRYANTYATGIRLLSAQKASSGRSGLPSLDDMVTHRVKGLSGAAGAFELACRTADESGNVVIKVVIQA